MTAARRVPLRSAQVRTTGLTLLITMLVLATAALWMVSWFRDELVGQVDDTLTAAVEYGRRLADSPATGALPPSPDTLAQVVDAGGGVVFASELLEGRGALLTPDPARSALGPVTVGDGSLGRLRVVGVELGSGSWLLIADRLEAVDDSVASLVRALLLAVGPVTVGLGLVLWFVVGRVLRPVAAARAREEELLADVSHELRSPIAGVRALLETEPDDPSERELNRIEALATLARLETITDGLLVVARQERRRPGSALGPVDLDEVVDRVVDASRVERRVPVDTSGVVAGQVLGNEADLESMVRNLVDNAVRHARSRAWVSLDEDDTRVVLTVADDGPGIPAEQREHVFDRFTRLDAARSRDEGGSGLGLAIVRAVVLAHGGSVHVADRPGGGAELVVELPSSLAGSAGRGADPRTPARRPDGAGAPVGS